jgi:hypothetical protein
MKFFVPDQSTEHAEDTYNDFQVLYKAADTKNVMLRIRLIGNCERKCNSALARKSLSSAVRSC